MMLGHTHYENLDVYFAYHHTVRNIVRSGTFPNDDNMRGNALKIVVLTMVIYACIILVKAVAAGNAICISQILLILINRLVKA